MKPLVFPPEVVASLPALKRYGSPLAVNLARRTTPGVKRLRAVVEAWMPDVPDPARAGLIGRLRDQNDRNHLGPSTSCSCMPTFGVAGTE